MKKYKGIALVNDKNIPRRIDIPETEEEMNNIEDLHTCPCSVIINDNQKGIQKMNKEYNYRFVNHKIDFIIDEIREIKKKLQEKKQ